LIQLFVAADVAHVLIGFPVAEVHLAFGIVGVAIVLAGPLLKGTWPRTIAAQVSDFRIRWLQDQGGIAQSITGRDQLAQSSGEGLFAIDRNLH
jgi:hypothetical protein